jgi:hypothetical protein
VERVEGVEGAVEMAVGGQRREPHNPCNPYQERIEDSLWRCFLDLRRRIHRHWLCSQSLRGSGLY